MAFIKGWLLALVMLSAIPPLAISGAVMSIVIGKLASQGQAAYSVAATVVEQTIGSIRTVSILGIRNLSLSFSFIIDDNHDVHSSYRLHLIRVRRKP